MNDPIKPMSFAVIAELSHGSPILCVEGTLASLDREPKRGQGQYGDWVLQNGVLRDDAGLEQRVCFGSDELLQPPDMRGKRIRVTAQPYKNAMKGITLSDKEKNGKHFRNIDIKFPAKVEVLGASTGQPVASPTAVQYPKPGDYRATQATHVEPEGEPMPTNEPMEDRMADFLKTLDLWCQFLGIEKEEVIKGWGPDKISEQVTGFMMSFKGKYNTHSRPIFKTQSSQVPETIAKQDALIERAVQATSGGNEPLTWKDYIYKGIKLGDHSDEKLVEMIKWAETSTTNTPEAILLRKHLLVAKAEREAAMDPDVQFTSHGETEEDSIPF